MGDKNKKKKPHKDNKRTQDKTRDGKEKNDSSPERNQKTRDKVPSREETVEEPSKETKTVDYQRESKKSKQKVKDKDVHPLDVIKNQPLDASSYVAKYQKINKGHYVDKFLASYPQYSMFGDNIPVAEESFLADVEQNRLKKEFKKDDEFNTKERKFKIVKPSSRRNMYYVVDDRGFVFIMKVEAVDAYPRGSLLERETMIRLFNREVHRMFQMHMMDFEGVGKIDKVCSFLVMHMARNDLVDLRSKLGKSLEYLPKDAVRINMQTLQAIHDVHLCRFVHRDIHPRNFQIGLYKFANVVYVFNFGLSYQYSPKTKHVSILAKLAKLSRTMQPRVFHTGLEYNCHSDMESWLYMCFWIFNGRTLVWRKEPEDIDERKMCNAKDLFFHGLYDDQLLQTLGPLVFKYLAAMRRKIEQETMVPGPGHINYSFFGEALLALAKDLNVDWNEPYQWQDYLPAAPGLKPKIESPKQMSPKSSAANEKTGGAKTVEDEKDGKADAPNNSVSPSAIKPRKKKKKTWQDTQTEDEETRDSSSSSAQTTEQSNFESKPSSPPKKKHS